MPRDRRATIGTDIWSHASMRGLTRHQRDAYMLARTQGDVNRCGVLPYRLRYLAGLAIDSTVEELAENYADLAATKPNPHVVVDEADELMLLRTHVKWDHLLSQPLVVASMIRDYHTISSPYIRRAFLTELRRLWEDPEVEPREHQGLELTLGGSPSMLGIKNADKVATAIGTGLLGPITDAIRNGYVEPYQPKGLPKGLTEGQLEGLTEGLTAPHLDPQSTVTVSATLPVPATATVTAPVTGATEPTPDDPTSGLLLEHIRQFPTPPPPSAIAPLRVEIMRLVSEHTTPDDIRAGLQRMRDKNLSARLLPQLVAEAILATTSHPKSTTDARVSQALALAERFAQPPTSTRQEITG